MAKDKTKCLIDVNVAIAVNRFLWAVLGYKHENPGFRCPKCKEFVEPVNRTVLAKSAHTSATSKMLGVISIDRRYGSAYSFR